MKLRSIEQPPRAAKPSGTLVLLHGYGADQNDLLPLAHELDPALRAVSLQAPHSLGGSARAWFNLQQTPRGFAYDKAEVEAALALAAEAVEEIGRTAGERPLLLGFSQGAALALSVALTRPGLVRGVLSFSGLPPSLDEDKLGPAAELRGLPVFAAHGQVDPLIPLEMGRLLRGALVEKGLAVEWHEYAMGHQVIEQELLDARSWMAGVLRKS
jgi:phospholipase/carboxylesterase